MASSSEQLRVARAVQANLEPEFEVTVWDQGVFHLSLTSLESLIQQAQGSDAAVFVFGPDDVTTLKGRKHKSVRDNVIFELGLFLGALGRGRCFIVMPSGTNSLRIPTDLAGITYGVYASERSDRNFRAALGPTCDQIRHQLGRNEDPIDSLKVFSSFQSQLIPWDDLFDNATELDLLFLGSHSWRTHHFLRLGRLCDREGAKVRVLLPDPENALLMKEVGESAKGAVEAKDRVLSALAHFRDFADSMKRDALSVYAIDRLPLFSVFRFSARALVCFYSHRRRLIGVPTLLCRDSDYSYQFAMEEFNYLLRRAVQAKRRIL